MASTWISRAATGSVTSSTTFTFSFWIKRGTLSSTQYFFIHENASGHTQKLELLFQTDNTIRMGWYDGSSEYNYDTEMVFTDTSAWYNFVFRYDTTQSTDSNRVRMYVNGEQISYLNANGSSPTYMTQNKAMNLGQKVMVHGRYQSSNPGNYLTGSLSHIHYCDGQSYAPTVFGETDSTTGEWKINTSPSVTYGNNGYFILKDGNRVVNDAGNSSGNFSVSGGTLTKTEDNPSNVFATLNPLDNPYVGQIATFSNGNTTGQSTETGHLSGASTIGVSTGKYYVEIKPTNGNVTYSGIGVMTDPISGLGSTPIHDSGKLYGIRGNGTKITGSSTTSSWSGSYTTNDILGLALDLDNNRLYISKNGQYADGSGNFDEAFTGSPAYVTLASNQTYFFVGGSLSTGSGHYLTIQANFGNGYFGTTAVSSAGTNASDNGIFEYDVPTGFTALSTKGLNL